MFEEDEIFDAKECREHAEEAERQRQKDEMARKEEERQRQWDEAVKQE